MTGKRIRGGPALCMILALTMVVAALVLAAKQPNDASQTVYMPSRVLGLQPSKMGHSLLVRGLLVPWQERGGATSYFLFGGPAVGTGGTLIIFSGPSSPLLAALRRVPLVGPWLPPTPDHPIVGRPATYRLSLIRSITAYTRFQLMDGGR